jgi:hypothetical protein
MALENKPDIEFVNVVAKIGFEFLTAVSTKMAVFWVVAPLNLYQTALQPRRQSSLLQNIVGRKKVRETETETIRTRSRPPF